MSEQAGHRLKYLSIAGILMTIAVCYLAYQKPCPNTFYEKFDMVHRGMNKNHVLFLLGQPDMSGGVKEQRKFSVKESDEAYISFFWEYFDKKDDSLKQKEVGRKMTEHEVPEPDEDAYVLFFDGTDRFFWGTTPRKPSH